MCIYMSVYVCKHIHINLCVICKHAQVLMDIFVHSATGP